MYGEAQHNYGPPQGYAPPPQQGYPPQQDAFAGQQIFQDPMANMAVQYGGTIASQGKDYVNKNVGFFLFLFYLLIFRSIVI